MSLAPDTPESHRALGYYYYQGHLDYERALDEIRIALRLRPEDPEAVFLQAAVSRRAGQIEEAARLLERVVAVDPGSAYFLHNLAETYWLLRRYPDADRTFERALSLNPRWGREHAYRAAVRLCETGDPARARALLPSAPATGDLRDGTVVSDRLIQFDFLERHYDEALTDLKAIKLDAFSEQWYYIPVARLAGDALRLKGDRGGARRNYETALALVERELVLRPQDPRLFSALGLIHAGLGHREEALRAAQTGVDLMPISREAYRGIFRAEDLARVQALVGDPDAAIDLLDDLLTRPGRLCVPVVRLDPAWDPLRRHPRFQTLLEKDGVSP